MPPSTLQNLISDPGRAFADVRGRLDAGLQQLNDAAAAPPLTHVTHNLGALKGPADSVLKFVHSGLQGPEGPQRFASYASMLGQPVMEAVTATPLGAPLLAGLYGALRGGESGTAAMKLFGPLLNRLGLGG
jgi:uncharacterized protein (DUF1800 family)